MAETVARAWAEKSKSNSGVSVTAKVCHTKADGALVCQFNTIQQNGLSPTRFRLLLLYESWRVSYVELAHKLGQSRPMPLRYRTGDVFPKTNWALLKEIFRLQVLAAPLQREKDKQKKLKEVGHGSS